jgi:hypothetical protein
MSCDSALSLVGPYFLIVGTFAAYSGISIWRHRERVDRHNTRYLGLGLGVLFAIIGAWVTFDQIRCGFPMPDFDGLIGPLEFTLWTPGLVFAAFAAGQGYWMSRGFGVGWRITFTLFGLALGIGGMEAAGFHVGIQANRWAAVTLLVGIAALAVNFVRKRSAVVTK